jgi:exopolysaccharide biosynthesis polyprenyl glycosylphosphotransferase
MPGRVADRPRIVEVKAPPARREDLLRIDDFAQPRATRRDTLFKRLLAAADVCAAACGLLFTALVTGQRVVAVSLATLPLIVVIMKVAGRYEHDQVVVRKSTLDEAPALAALGAAYALAWSLATITFQVHSSRAAVIALWAGTAGSLILLRSAVRGIGQRLAPRERVLVLGGTRAQGSMARRLAADSSAHVEVVGFVPLEREADDARREEETRTAILTAQELHAIVEHLDVHRVIAIPTTGDAEAMLEVVIAANMIGVKVSIVPSVFEVVGSAVEFDELGGMTALGVRRPGLSRSSAWIKRATDIIGAAVGLIVLAPFGLLIALAIRIDTPGPVFFRQPRIGRGGGEFQMIKFRSMVATAEEQRANLESLNESAGIFKISNDPRVTRVGRLLRQTSLDELPQLINVLRGEMSLVGPRPLLPEEDRQVAGPHRTRLHLAPGMTGPWQVLGPLRPPLGEMVKLDYLYAANWSLWSDMKFILRTVPHVFGRRGV